MTATANLPAESSPVGKSSVAAVAKQAANLTELQTLLVLPIVDLAEYGDGLDIIGKDGASEDTLLGVPFVIFDARFNPGKYGKDFISLSIATLDNTGAITGRFVLNDGSTGIADQWQRLQGQIPEGALFLVKKGLRKSDFLYSAQADRVVTADEGYGDAIPASTYYLNI